jgi:Tfp pilus assembly protein PilF
VHSIKRIAPGNDLCLQCHKTAVYDTRDHHFHKKKGEKGEAIRSKSGEILFAVGSGAQCEQCHMPGRRYMGIDYRPDHSFRIPRPDLSLSIAAPNACNHCHLDKSSPWSLESVKKWYGQRKRSHYGTVIFAGRQRRPEARSDLIRLADDRRYPAIVRATALSLLEPYPGAESRQAFERALLDEESLVRYTAVRHRVEADPRKRISQLGPLLYDPVKAVRIEAARNLVGIPRDRISADLRQKLPELLDEYRQVMERTADFAPSRLNLGNLYADLGQTEKAVANYRKAIAIDNQFYPAKVNLAMLYNRQGDNEAAEGLLREVVGREPDLYDVKYSLGLLLAEMKKYDAAAVYLKEAADGLPGRSRIHYNLALLLQYLQRDGEAEVSLKKALELAPDNRDYLYALAEFLMKHGRLKEARPIVERLIQAHPSDPMGRRMLDFLERQ